MSRIFIDKFHHCWLLKCSKSWTKKSVRQRTPSYQRAKKGTHTLCDCLLISIYFIVLFYACTLLCPSLLTGFWTMASENTIDWCKNIYGTDRKSNTKKTVHVVCRSDWCLCMCNVHWLALAVEITMFLHLFFSVRTKANNHSIQWRKCAQMNTYSLFKAFYVTVLLLLLFSMLCASCFYVYVLLTSLVWWCRLPKLQFFSTFSAVCDSVQHKVSNWTNALIYCDPFGLSLEYSIAIVTLQIFGVKIFPSFFSPLFDAFVFCSVIFVSHFVSHL